MKKTIRTLFFLSGLLIAVFSCKKENGSTTTPPATYKLTYGDSIFYLNGQANDYIVSPLEARAGEYIGFPEGIEIDSKTGAVNVTKSETGLRYRITFIPQGKTDSISTTIVISGVNFLDGFYKLNTADSILKPIYNGNNNSVVPGVNNGTIFDDGSGCNSAGCNVNVGSGTINLAQTVRNGVFGSTPSNNDRHEFEMDYRINDKSSKALNKLRVKLYYFDSINDVTQEVYDIISSREGTLLGIQPKATTFQRFNAINSIGQTTVLKTGTGKPRPPCIFILSR